MAIVHATSAEQRAASYEMVELLLKNGADVHALAFGPFFSISGPCYFGQLPLSFAASLGLTDIVRLLIEHGARLDAQDMYGHTALHMAVWHSRPGMFDELLKCSQQQQAEARTQVDGSDSGRKDAAAAAGAGEGEAIDLRDIRSNRGWTPALLAVYKDNVAMFRHIIASRRKLNWDFGPVTCYKVPLNGAVTGRCYA